MWKRKTKGGRPYVEPKLVPPVVKDPPEEEREAYVSEGRSKKTKGRKSEKTEVDE